MWFGAPITRSGVLLQDPGPLNLITALQECKIRIGQLNCTKIWHLPKPNNAHALSLKILAYNTQYLQTEIQETDSFLFVIFTVSSIVNNS